MSGEYCGSYEWCSGYWTWIAAGQCFLVLQDCKDGGVQTGQMELQKACLITQASLDDTIFMYLIRALLCY